MPILSNEQIEEKANEVLLSFYGSKDKITLPVDVKDILVKNGLSVKTGRFPKNVISGAYSRGEKTVYTEETDSEERQFFTLAHEAGHYFLHAEEKADEVYLRTSFDQLDKEVDPIEKQANYFAVSLLLPKNLVVKYWSALKNVEETARVFGVSPFEMKYRLIGLGLIESERV